MALGVAFKPEAEPALGGWECTVQGGGYVRALGSSLLRRLACESGEHPTPEGLRNGILGCILDQSDALPHSTQTTPPITVHERQGRREGKLVLLLYIFP